MKKILMGAAAAMAIAAPGLAHADDTSGYVAFSYNSLDDDNDSSKEDYLTLGGAVATPLGNGWGLQLNADSADMSHGNHTDSHTNATVHAFSRNDQWAFGGFAGMTGGEIENIYIGAEGAMYFNRFTLAANALIGANREQDDENLSSIQISGSYFVTDNFSVGADVDETEADFGGSSNWEGTGYGVNAEYQFANSGFSVYGGWHWDDADDFGTDNDLNSGTIGVRYNFGGGSLIERDRHGASMSGGSQIIRDQVFSY